MSHSITRFGYETGFSIETDDGYAVVRTTVDDESLSTIVRGARWDIEIEHDVPEH